jgi:hypothetical protein
MNNKGLELQHKYLGRNEMENKGTQDMALLIVNIANLLPFNQHRFLFQNTLLFKKTPML